MSNVVLDYLSTQNHPMQRIKTIEKIFSLTQEQVISIVKDSTRWEVIERYFCGDFWHYIGEYKYPSGRYIIGYCDECDANEQMDVIYYLRRVPD